ncbi:MAG: polymer-forming cytoskeletal protein [Bacteroidales bacterium]|nr:polymer-forming cytoskeletal protein [Bacteroidales bacterium]
MAKNNIIESTVNLLGKGTVIKGEIKSGGDFRVDGTLIGAINSKGKVVVGNTGNIEGEIICQNADISGSVKAQVAVSELLSLKATATLTGDVTTNKLAIEPGAKFSGSCNMDGAGLKNENFSLKNEKTGFKEKVI